jgi:hypothetical protein
MADISPFFNVDKQQIFAAVLSVACYIGVHCSVYVYMHSEHCKLSTAFFHL